MPINISKQTLATNPPVSQHHKYQLLSPASSENFSPAPTLNSPVPELCFPSPRCSFPYNSAMCSLLALLLASWCSWSSAPIFALSPLLSLFSSSLALLPSLLSGLSLFWPHSVRTLTDAAGCSLPHI